MSITYDKYYQTDNLFGDPYSELLAFFSNYPNHGKVLDLGCGQGRDAIALAKMGFEVTGIDNSNVGIAQMNLVAKGEELKLQGVVADIFEYNDFSNYDFVLLDSMFHFNKKDLLKETEFVKRILSSVNESCLIVFCIQDTGNKVEVLNKTIDCDQPRKRIVDQGFKYVYEDKETGHRSESDYRMVVVKK